jgi:uncharacterized BrkB/YihY/UPF0761 family membrane protein
VDNGLGLAAQLAYYFFFALLLAILVGIALASFFRLAHSWTGRRDARGVVPATTRSTDAGGCLSRRFDVVMPDH